MPDVLLAAMVELESAGMQKLAFEAILFGKMFIEVKIPMLIVQHNGITNRCEVKPDLMHAPGFNVHARQRGL